MRAHATAYNYSEHIMSTRLLSHGFRMRPWWERHKDKAGVSDSRPTKLILSSPWGGPEPEPRARREC
eukprot:scaffold306409_cov37-Tisochrysis_lutea.AAC.1